MAASLVESSGCSDDDGRGILASISFFASFRNSSLLNPLFGPSSPSSGSGRRSSSSTTPAAITSSTQEESSADWIESQDGNKKSSSPSSTINGSVKRFNCCSAFCSDFSHHIEQKKQDNNLCHENYNNDNNTGQTTVLRGQKLPNNGYKTVTIGAAAGTKLRKRIIKSEDGKDGDDDDRGCDGKENAFEKRKLVDDAEQKEDLVRFEVLPEYLQFNPNVLEGYRKPNMSSMECIKSLFYFHNETINIYTHLISFLLFAFIMPGRLPWKYGITRPFLAYCTILGSFSSWVGSSMYHLFMNHEKGEQFYDTLLMIDVIGIWVTQSIGAATTITTSVLLYDSNLQVAFVSAYMFLSLRALKDVLLANSVWTRILGFSYLFAFRLVAFGLRIHAIPTGASPLIHIVMQEGWALIGSVISATRVPERWFPGRFDYLLNSHNLMHLFVVFGALHMHAATSADLLWIKDIDEAKNTTMF